MSYFYVDSTIGSRTTGGGTTKQTGTFTDLGATNLYASRTLAIADGAGSGDIIVVAARSAQSSAESIVIAGPTTGGFLTCIVAEDDNCDVSVAATTAIETTTGTSSDIKMAGRLSTVGDYLHTKDDILLGDANTYLKSLDGTYSATGGSDIALKLGADGCCADLINPTFICGSTSIPFSIIGGSILRVFGGIVTGAPNKLTTAGFYGGGGVIEADGLDISGVTSTVFSGAGGTETADDLISITLRNCPSPASVVWLDEVLKGLNHRLEVSGCANTAAHAEYQFYTEALGGYVDDQDDSGIHRDESPAFGSGTKVSMHVLTNSDASLATPFWFDVPSIFAELSTTTNKVRVYLASTVALDNTNIFIDALYEDDPNGHKLNLISTRPTNRLIAAGAGTTLTADTGSTWKNGAADLTGYNEYYIDIDTSGDAGLDCVPKLRVNVAIPSTAIYLDIIPDVVA